MLVLSETGTWPLALADPPTGISNNETPLQRIYIGNRFDQTSRSEEEDSSLLLLFLLDFTLFYVKGL